MSWCGFQLRFQLSLLRPDSLQDTLRARGTDFAFLNRRRGGKYSRRALKHLGVFPIYVGADHACLVNGSQSIFNDSPTELRDQPSWILLLPTTSWPRFPVSFWGRPQINQLQDYKSGYDFWSWINPIFSIDYSIKNIFIKMILYSLKCNTLKLIQILEIFDC